MDDPNSTTRMPTPGSTPPPEPSTPAPTSDGLPTPEVGGTTAASVPPPVDPRPPLAGSVPPPVTDVPAPVTAVPPPSGTWQAPPSRDAGRTASLIAGLVLLGIGAWFFVDQTLGIELPPIRWSQLWPLLLIGIGAWILFSAARRGSR
ncbi:MAG TPA: DUF5668 domain-containing protein [Candidatus Saccharimonadales bacterium]|nr:DUF5668 domain-containing protein [Candidatus Saccharimonadales bacterium]